MKSGRRVSAGHRSDAHFRLLAEKVREYASGIQNASRDLIAALGGFKTNGAEVKKVRRLTASRRERPVLADLTGRQQQILELLAAGNSAKEAAALLGISPKTAYVHRSQIMQRLGLHSQSDLIYFAIRAGVSLPRQIGKSRTQQ